MSPFIYHIIIITILDVAGSITAKFWILTRNPLLLILTFVLFGSAGYVFARSLQYEGMAIANVLWIALSIMIVTVIGYFAFKEEIAHIQLIGIGVIMIGLMLIHTK